MDKRVTSSADAPAIAPVAVRDLTKTYGQITAVDHISFTLAAASTVALLGGNGAGKTTTIAMLLGLVVPTSGEVRVFGADMSKERGSIAHRLNFQSPYVDLPSRLTVRQNLTVYAGLYGIANARERIAYVAEDLQIVPMLDRETGKLSAGQKTRVGLAKALLNAPELLLLDEPTASLDPDTADWIRRKLKDYAQSRGATLLLASHNMTEVERLADRVILLDQGRILEDETPARPDRDLRPQDARRGVPRRGARPCQASRREARKRDRSGKEGVMTTLSSTARGAEPVVLPPNGLAASFRRIGALVKRYVYLLRSSGVRLVELIYWPFLQMLTWGFLQKYLAATTSPLAQGAGVLIGSVLLWDILFRSKIGFSTTFIEEMWSRNLGNLLTSPLRAYELVAALSLWSVIRLGVSMVPVAIAAYFIFGFNLLGLGLPLVAFFAVLVLTSWSLGLISAGVILRYGLGAEELAWSLAFLLLPLCCVYYPVSVLPGWLQVVALALPPTHVFEGMRSILLRNTFDPKELWWALSLNAVYLFAGYLTFSRFLASARVNGTLIQLGE